MILSPYMVDEEKRYKLGFLRKNMQMILQKQLLLATNNPGKVKEMRQLLSSLSGVQLLTPADIGLELTVDESGRSYRQNAAIKARGFAEAAGLTALADDSGLEVEALDGAPGLHSARYTGKPNASYPELRAYLLRQLEAFPRPWIARFRATIAIAQPGGEIRYAEGSCPGEIIPQERGQAGFGYDPIFLLPQLGRTMAELGHEEKNAISHRGNAIRKALPQLSEIFDR